MKVKNQVTYVLQFLIIVLLLQSCSVYKPTSLTFKQLSENNNKIKIRTNDKRTLKFEHIRVIDGSYYGVNKRESKRILIFENDIESIKLRDKKASKGKTIIVLTFGILALYLLIFGPDGDIWTKG